MSDDVAGDNRAAVPRRTLIKAAAAAAGAAAGSGALGGFPTIWAQTIKDITLNHVGGAVSAIPEIAAQASKDLGFKIQMQVIDTEPQISRVLTQPNTVDINDMPTTSLYYLMGRGVLQAIPLSKYKMWDQTLPIFTKGLYPDGKKTSSQGTSPIKVQYTESMDFKKFASKPTEFLTFLPTLYNADTLGIRPDLVGRPIKSWKDLLDPAFKGKAALQDNSAIGIMDVAMALEARGDIKYGDKGNMTKEEIDKTIDIITGIKRAGQFRAFWTTFDQSVNFMASSEVVIQSMWSPAVTAVRARGIPCVFAPLNEGYRGWEIGLSLMSHLSGMKLEAAYDYLNWYNAGWQGAFIAREGYYTPIPDNAKKFLTPAEWDYWYEGKPAASDIKDPYGKVIEKEGSVRDGGSFWNRVGNIACWNSIMDQDRYLTRRWNQFIAS
jgi:putative spermidine/putrescine transport system substrate-binding protein